MRLDRHMYPVKKQQAATASAEETYQGQIAYSSVVDSPSAGVPMGDGSTGTRGGELGGPAGDPRGTGGECGGAHDGGGECYESSEQHVVVLDVVR